MKKYLKQTAKLKEFGVSIIVFVSRFRILPPNFSFLGSFGFFSNNFLIYASIIVLFDFFKGGFYEGFLFTYLGFVGYFIFGKIAKSSLKKQFVLLPIASLLFFLISNFGVWFYWYPNSIEGLITCYTLALPFYRNTLISDLVFGYGFIFLREVYRKNYLERLLNLKEY